MLSQHICDVADCAPNTPTHPDAHSRAYTLLCGFYYPLGLHNQIKMKQKNPYMLQLCSTE